MGLHLVWIGWVIVGTLFTRGRPFLTAFHLASLGWGIVVDMGPWACPLTVLENWLDIRSGGHGFSGGFIAHYMGAVLYPNAPGWIVIACGVAVCCGNLLVYAYRLARWLRMRSFQAPVHTPKAE